MKISQKTQRQLLQIAMEHMATVEQRGDLETRHSDSEDFLDIAVWCLKDALEAAYELGRQEAQHER